jgi:phosphoglucomutase
LKNEDTEIISKITNTISFFESVSPPSSFQLVPEGLVDSYFSRILSNRKTDPSELRLVFTPLCGVGNKPVRRVLSHVKDLWVVPEQALPDPGFKTCPCPNPEDSSAWEFAIKLAKQKNAQLVLATDPDCDRIGVAELNGDYYHLFSGDDIGVLLLDYLCRNKNKKSLTGGLVVKSIVTTNMVEAVAQKYGLNVYATLPGFKNMCGKMDEIEVSTGLERFLICFEESNGFLLGTHARDKDGVLAALMVSEMAGAFYDDGETLFEHLETMYEELGFYLSFADSFVFDGVGAMAQMSKIMDWFRQRLVQNIAGYDVVRILDYKTGKEIFSQTGELKVVTLPVSDVLDFYLDGQNRVVMRPSGTEPKLKFYYFVFGEQKAETIKRFECLKEYLRAEITRLICELHE